MKKYNTPEIEALALETIDVIATSGGDAALAQLKADGFTYDNAAAKIDAGVLSNTEKFTSTWSW